MTAQDTNEFIERYKRWLQNTGFDGGPDSPPMVALGLIERQAAENDRLMHVIDRDRYIVAAVMTGIQAAINGRYWLSGGRGPYEYDDDRYQQEFGAALNEIEGAMQPLGVVAFDKADCATGPAKVEAAKQAAIAYLKRPQKRREIIAADLGIPCRCTEPPLARPLPIVQAEPAWTCFHCGDTFTDPTAARLHFGRDERSEAACTIKAGAERSLLRALRNAEQQADDAVQAMHDESTDAARAYHQQRCRHADALIAAEELGYERGLADGSTASEVLCSALRPFADVADLLNPNCGDASPIALLPSCPVTAGDIRRAAAAMADQGSHD
ncbi:hypothetical protein GRI97_08280 [Altererythrobacter xixiisoli]|uniref:Uncharacterized protein n=1 Tax=Croceibacterium xixiisoli TaxID=1476466 RepID=A0A6I4TSX8_9SPHN|nr:hypothetical protein [Croceibacterium xixiisoli]MXO98984.1 hypothetical protein [Croceibacterium xixiisoli]